ncbi:hypothetical protein, partial [Desulfovibrio piger]|uniref:hypothetical protein n=1 Tax=Desulfovibrio piger TaxID=901 RepID=UPI0026F19DDF
LAMPVPALHACKSLLRICRCRRMERLRSLSLAAFPHRDLTMFALGGLAVWCLMPGRDSGKKGPSGRS